MASNTPPTGDLTVEDSAQDALNPEFVHSVQWILAGQDTAAGVAGRYVEYLRCGLDIGLGLAAEGHFDPAPIQDLQEFLDHGTAPASIGNTTSTSGRKPRSSKKDRLSNKDGNDAEEDGIVGSDESEEDSGGEEAGVTRVKITKLVKRPRTERCILEKTKLLPLCSRDVKAQWAEDIVQYLRAVKTDLASKAMVGLQKLLAFAFSVEGARSLASSAAFARSSHSMIGLHKDIVATEDSRADSHYSALTQSLITLQRLRFDGIYQEIETLVQYVSTAKIYLNFEKELLDCGTQEYVDYQAALEAHDSKYKKLNVRASRRHYILTQAVRGMFGENHQGARAGETDLSKKHYGEMERQLSAALTLSYLGDAFGKGIHALLIASEWEKMAADAFDDNLVVEVLEQLADTSPWLKRVCERAHDNVWKYFIDPEVWGRVPPELLNVEVLEEKEQARSNLMHLVSFDYQNDEDVEMIG